MKKFNMRKYCGKTAMAVPLPSEEVRRQMQEQGYGLAVDEADHFKEIRNKLTELDSDTKNQMGISGGQTIRTIPLGESLVVDGRTVYPRAIDEDRGELIALDLSIPPGQPNEIPPPPGSRAAPTTEPNNYIRIPLSNPVVSEFIRRHQEQSAPQREKLLNIVKDWNRFLREISQPEKFKGVNLVQIPLMVFKERSSLIRPRMEELRAMETHFETKLASEPIPSSLLAAENEWRQQINNHSLNLQDTTDTILKLYKGREERIQPDIDSGELNPPEEWRRWWMAEREIQGEDGQIRTVTNYQYIVNTIISHREAQRARGQSVKEDVSLPKEFLEEIPTRQYSGPATFTGPAASMLARDRAALAGVRDEIEALENLDKHLQDASSEIVKMESKSDEYLLAHPEEYAKILNGIKRDASEFVRRYSGSLQTKEKVWKKSPKNIENMSPAQRAQLKPTPEGGMMLPGSISANFVGNSTASLGVSIYLYRIIGIINEVDQRLVGKAEGLSEHPEVVQASNNIEVKNMKKTVESWGGIETKAQEQQKPNKNEKLAALRMVQWMADDSSKLDKVFESVADLSGADLESAKTMDSQMKIDIIKKTIHEMPTYRLSAFVRFLSNV